VDLDYRTIFGQAAEHDPVSIRLRDRALTCWAALCVNLVHAFDVDRIILGGGIMASADTILPAVRQYVSDHAHASSVGVVAAEHPDHMALLGCEWLVQEKLSNKGGHS
jgi:glucokinase